MVSVFSITQEYRCLCLCLGAATCSSFLQSASAWVLWGRGCCTRASFAHISPSKQGLRQSNSLLLLLATSRAAWPPLCRSNVYTVSESLPVAAMMEDLSWRTGGNSLLGFRSYSIFCVYDLMAISRCIFQVRLEQEFHLKAIVVILRR